MTTEVSKAAPRRLAHVALRVRDVDRSVAFYTDVVGLKLWHRGGPGAFLGISEDTSHELALFPLGMEASGPDPKQVGMYHIAWITDSFETLEQLHQRLIDSKTKIAGYADSTNSSNVMFFDPDGNELEFIWEPSEDVLARTKASGARLPKLQPAI